MDTKKTYKEKRLEMFISQTEMGKILGLHKNTIGNYEKEGKILSDDDEIKLMYAIPRKTKTDLIMDVQDIPLYDIEASASIERVFSDTNPLVPMGYIRIPSLMGCDGAMYTWGDAMYPSLKAGDIVCYKILQDKTNIDWGAIHVVYINHNGDEFLYTKYVQKSEKEGYIKLVSQNQHHQDIHFPMDSVVSVAHIKASIRINSKI